MKRLLIVLLMILSLVTLIGCIKTNESDENPLFNNGLAPIKTKEGYVYINNKFKVALNDNYLTASKFYKGTAVVETLEGYFVIDEKGNKLSDNYQILTRYESIDSIIYAKSNNEYGLLDLNGKVIFTTNEYQLHDVLDELILGSSSTGYGALNKKGEVVIDFKYNPFNEFSHSAVYLTDKSNEYHYVIDTKGNILFKKSFDEMDIDNLRIIDQTKYIIFYEDKNTYINNLGEPILPVGHILTGYANNTLIVTDLTATLPISYLADLDGNILNEEAFAQSLSLSPSFVIGHDYINNSVQIFDYNGNKLYPEKVRTIHDVMHPDYFLVVKYESGKFSHYYYHIDGTLIYHLNDVTHAGRIIEDSITKELYLTIPVDSQYSSYVTYKIKGKSLIIATDILKTPIEIISNLFIYYDALNQIKIRDLKNGENFLTLETILNYQLYDDGYLVVEGKATSVIDIKNNNKIYTF
ncbi:WG repeat-containing protein [Acholeplasma hippikon]|uniref:KWG Leptospira n=1 Tax=Acholeplasma hippikon TaxID=264636 RepID=A0A449BKU3_9MOLU|nr:WG repeat-containing protein [Acholeplasma hippikon]VEU83096.1 Uncharacterised protein [Acholeplasma hippikon]